VRGIEALVIVGVSTNNSVEATARSAGNLGLRTYVLADACFAFDKRDYHGTCAAPTTSTPWRWPICRTVRRILV
jgi:nicotinamidase-related amidase